MPWATLEQVETITGVTCSAEQLAQAQGIVEIYVDREYDADATFRDADTRRLKQAVAWQAAWLVSQVEVAGRSGVTTYTQDGLDITRPDISTIVLAPLTRRAILNLSWMRTRSIRTPAAMPERSGALSGWSTDEGIWDDSYTWVQFR